MRDFLAVVGLVALLYAGAAWVGDIPLSHAAEVLALLLESAARGLRLIGG